MCRINVYIAGLAFASAVAFCAVSACDPTPGSPLTDAGQSPNASIQPAPLAAEPDLGNADAAAPSPQGLTDPTARWAQLETLPVAGPLAADVPPFPKEPGGVVVEGLFRFRDVPSPPRAPEVSLDAHRDAQKAVTLTVHADLAELGRMRFELTGGGFLFPARTELRSRVDRLAHVIVWPGSVASVAYRVLPVGAMRAAFGEHRADVMPLSPGSFQAEGDGRRIGYAVKRTSVTSSVATVRFEIGRVPESGDGGLLLCRALVELGGIDPRSSICQPGEIPIFVSYAWREGGGITFEVTSIAKRTDLGVNGLLVPPAGAQHQSAGLPAVPRGIFLSREAFASLRTAPVPVSASRDNTVPGEGFVAQNQSDRPMILLLDGVAAVWVPPLAEQYVVGPTRGRYGAQWRSFLGEVIGPSFVIEVPARVVYGHAVDEHASDAGPTAERRSAEPSPSQEVSP